jgi:hypothetical protein
MSNDDSEQGQLLSFKINIYFPLIATNLEHIYLWFDDTNV